MRLAVLGSLLLASRALAVPAAAQGVVKVLEGLARIQPAGSAVWTNLRKGDVVRVGDRIKTLDGSRVQMAMKPTGLVTLGPLASIEITDPATHKPTAAQGSVGVRLKLLVGSLFARVHTDKSRGEFGIETPAAVAAVKGCGFGLHVNPDLETLLITLEGLVRLTNQHGPVDVHEGFQATVKPNAPVQPPVPFDVKRAPIWLGTTAGEGDEQTVEVTITDSDGVPQKVILKFKKGR